MWIQIFSQASQSLYLHTQMTHIKTQTHTHIVFYKNTHTLTSYTWTVTYSVMKMSLWLISPQTSSHIHLHIQHDPSHIIPHVEDTNSIATYILTGEYAHTYEVHIFTRMYSSVLICTHLDINSQKYTPLSHDQEQTDYLTYMNMPIFMPMVTHSLIHMKSSIYFNTQTHI